jgi:hypothetical protein
MMVNFIALYRGRTLNDAEVIAITGEVSVVSEFAERMLMKDDGETDPILRQAQEGKRRVLELVRDEAGAAEAD